MRGLGRQCRRLLGRLLLCGAFLAPGLALGDQTDARLDALFDRLRTTPSAIEANAIESQIWAIWLESGREQVDAWLEEGMLSMSTGDYDQAIALFDRVVKEAPDFAEGWNKRATAYYLNDEYTASVLDIEHTLALEPRHFGAISGMGLIFLSEGDLPGALRAFETVLQIHPHAAGARARVKQLREALRGQGA